MTTPFSIALDTAALNQALFQVTHGLYILTAAHAGRDNGQCLDALMQVTNLPPRIAVGVGRRTLTHDFIAAGGLFVVNVLDRNDPACFEKVRHFGFQSGRKTEKFSGGAFERAANGAPILPDALAFYECRVESSLTVDLGSHALFVARVERAGVRAGGEPLTYNEYRKTMKQGR